jgi:hypothetical protein
MRAGLFKVEHVKTDYSQRIRLLLRHRQAMVRRNKDLINTVGGTLKAFGIRTGGGKNCCSQGAFAKLSTTRRSWS